MISRRHKTIFVHIPKTAGQAIETAYLQNLGLTWDQRIEVSLGPNTDPRLGPPKLAHLLGSDYVERGHISEQDFATFYKFSIVRDPWARTVSLYRHLGVNLSFDAFVLDWLGDVLSRGDRSPYFWFVRPQCDYLTVGGQIVVDDVLRFEHLAEEFRKVAKRSGLHTTLPRVNEVRRRPRPDINGKPPRFTRLARKLSRAFQKNNFEVKENWMDNLSPTTVAKIGHYYAKDVEKFEYSQPDHGSLK